MSLYDKASLVLIPSGTKAGKVYSQKPVPSNDVLSDELLTNGDFEQGSIGWSLQTGTAVFSNGNVEFQGSTIIRDDIDMSSKTVFVTYTVESADTNARLQLYDGSWFDAEDSVGTHTVSFVASSDIFYLRNSDSGNITLSSVSVKKVVDGDFDFTRSSYATRVNSQGLIEKERSNLIRQSNSFDTTWSSYLTTETSGQSGYDGSLDAWLIERSGLFGNIFQSQTSSGIQTYSVYAKSGTYDWVYLRYRKSDLSYSGAYFDLSSGVIGGTGSTINQTIESIGSGWYRCSITFSESLSQVLIYPTDSNGGIGNSGTGSIYIQDAQLEQGLVATDVIETTTSAVYEGITDNVPRLDYDGDCPSLLLEPQRQNLVIHSEYLEGLNQNTLNLSLSTNLSPEGKYNAYRAERVSGSQLGYSFAATSGETFTTSIYARSISGSGQINITDYQGSANIFNITSDWARYELSAEATQSTGRAYVRLPQVGDVVEFYGFQSEQGSYATSYIPTYGTSVTRTEDVCNNAGDSTIFNDDEGVLYFEAKTDNDDAGSISINNGTLSNRLTARFRPDISKVQLSVFGTTDDFNYNSATITLTEYNKIAIVYNNGQYYFFVNGVKSTIQNRGTFDSNDFTQLDFNRGGGSEHFYGDIKVLAYFNRALTDTELVDLTT